MRTPRRQALGDSWTQRLVRCKLLSARYSASNICVTHGLATIDLDCAPAGPLLAKGVGDTNAAAQDAAIEALLAYLIAGSEVEAARCHLACFVSCVQLACNYVWQQHPSA